MPKGLCPHMKKYAKEFIKTKAIQCLKCKGSGFYIKKSEVIFEQSQESFKKRVKVWQAMKKQKIYPQKKILNKQCSTTKIKCNACSSNGAIERFKFCCMKGCKLCHFSGVTPSRRWQQCKNAKKKEDKQLNKNKQIGLQQVLCKICLKSFKIENQQELDILFRCKHIIHKACVEKIRQKRPNYCPQCRDEEADYFAQKEDISEDSNYSENLFFFERDDLEDDENIQTVQSEQSIDLTN